MQHVEQILDSREVAEMVKKEHKKLLRDIRVYIDQLNQANFGPVKEMNEGENSPTSNITSAKISAADFFRESTYKDAKGEERPCYLITKKGCEFIAHKLTGQKGTEFTARYITRFHEMEEQLQRENHTDWFVNDIRVFQHREFGILRTLKVDGQDYFIGKDVTTSLGYVNNTDALKKRVSDAEKCYVAICDGSRSRKMVVITLKGMEELIKTGRLPLANKYSEWIYGQVIPTMKGKLPEMQDTQKELPSAEAKKEPFDIAPLFREFLSLLPLEALDEMEKGLRKGKSRAINLAVTAILTEKIKRQIA